MKNAEIARRACGAIGVDKTQKSCHAPGVTPPRRRIIWRSRSRACSVLGLRGGGVVLTLRVLKASHGALGLSARHQDGLHRGGALLVRM